jgi:hypothetical protein
MTRFSFHAYRSEGSRSEGSRSEGSGRSGFTLLELFLTLAMAVVLMTLINSAFRFYARDMDANDIDLQQTMLAAAVMQMIEDDLRSSLHPEPLDTAALEELLSKTAAAAGGMEAERSNSEMSEDDLEAAGMDDASTDEMTGEDALTSEMDTASLVSGAAVLETAGLIGNQFQIQIDVSRLPRLEEYAVMLEADPTKLTDVPSDLKTVTYYVQSSDSYGISDPLDKLDPLTQAGAASSSQSGGLVRRVLDRSATSFAVNAGNLSTLGQTGELLAPEVVSIEFQYWDGVTWQIEWNSDELGELPQAVQIQMAMLPPGASTDMVDEVEPRVFRHIVRLPLAKPLQTEEEDAALMEAGI